MTPHSIPSLLARNHEMEVEHRARLDQSREPDSNVSRRAISDNGIPRYVFDSVTLESPSLAYSHRVPLTAHSRTVLRRHAAVENAGPTPHDDEDEIHLTLSKSRLQELQIRRIGVIQLLQEGEQLRREFQKVDLYTQAGESTKIASASATDIGNGYLQEAEAGTLQAQEEKKSAYERWDIELSQQLLALRFDEQKMLGIDGFSKALNILASQIDPRAHYNFREPDRGATPCSEFANSSSRSLISNSGAAQAADSNHSALSTAMTTENIFERPILSSQRYDQGELSASQQDCCEMGSWTASIGFQSAPRQIVPRSFDEATSSRNEVRIAEIWLSPSLLAPGNAIVKSDSVEHLYVKVWLLRFLIEVRTQRLLMGIILEEYLKHRNISIQQNSGQEWARLIENYWWHECESALQYRMMTRLGPASSLVKTDQPNAKPQTDTTNDGKAIRAAFRPNSSEQSVVQDADGIPARQIRTYAAVLASRRPETAGREQHGQQARDTATNSRQTIGWDSGMLRDKNFSAAPGDRAPQPPPPIPYVVETVESLSETDALHQARHSVSPRLFTADDTINRSQQRSVKDLARISRTQSSRNRSREADTTSTSLQRGQIAGAIVEPGREPFTSSAEPRLTDGDVALYANRPVGRSGHRPRPYYQTTSVGISSEIPSKGSPASIPISGVEAIFSAGHGQSDFPPFTILQHRGCQDFVKIPVDEFGQRLEYLLRHKELLSRDASFTKVHSDLFMQSIDFARMKEGLASTACSLCLALIQVSKDQQSATLPIFFTRLKEDEAAERKQFEIVFKKLTAIIASQAMKKGPLEPITRSTAVYLNRTIDRRDSNDESRWGRSSVLKDTAEQDSEDFETWRTKITTDLMGKNLERISCAIDPSESRIPEIRGLGPLYRQRQGNTWYKPGKMFAIVWHEAAGEPSRKKKATDDLMDPREKGKFAYSGDSSRSPAAYGTTVYTFVRRLIVIRNRHGSCWCVPVGTYGGRGLRKPGLTRKDINAHAVVFDAARQPVYLLDEPISNKRPIAIKMATGATLDQASRLHLGKPYSVEWNVKVMDVGDVVPEDLEALISYVKEELFG